MSDRELLELAAKAAGVVINKARTAERDEAGYGHLGLWTTTTTNWNPLTDDGDALRLAVRLEMDIFFNDGDTDVLGVSEGGGDPFKRTRRAIVRAAAEIGRGMP